MKLLVMATLIIVNLCIGSVFADSNFAQKVKSGSMNRSYPKGWVPPSKNFGADVKSGKMVRDYAAQKRYIEPSATFGEDIRSGKTERDYAARNAQKSDLRRSADQAKLTKTKDLKIKEIEEDASPKPEQKTEVKSKTRSLRKSFWGKN